MIKTVVLLNSEEEAVDLSNQLKNLNMNLDVIVTKNIESFITLISKDKVDCFVLDWKYEECAIADLVHKIRKSKKYHKSPIAFVVDNESDAEMIAEYSSLGIDLLINRPCNVDQFKLQLKITLNKKLGSIIPEDYEVLVVDDNPAVLDIHVENLVRLHHSKYQLCTNLKEAKETIDNQNFDLLILDWNFSDGTCIDLINYIRSKKENKRLNDALIFVVTGRDNVDDILTLLSYGIKDYIIKPFEFNEFEDKLTYALEKHRKKLLK